MINMIKLYILVRTDKEFSIGKLMVHVGHVCTELVYRCNLFWKVRDWYIHDHTIIILSVKDLNHLNDIYNMHKELFQQQPRIMVKDAGFYEVDVGTVLMCGLLLDDIEYKKLKLNKLRLFKHE